MLHETAATEMELVGINGAEPVIFALIIFAQNIFTGSSVSLQPGTIRQSDLSLLHTLLIIKHSYLQKTDSKSFQIVPELLLNNTLHQIHLQETQLTWLDAIIKTTIIKKMLIRNDKTAGLPGYHTRTVLTHSPHPTPRQSNTGL